jgi:chemotaxis protein histidine kinase CheA
LEIIRNNLGDEYLDSGRRVFVSLDQAKELGKLGKDLLALGDTLPDALAERVAPLLDMGRESLRGMLVQYPRAVERLARQRGKEVLPFEVEGDDILVDPERFSPLVHALAHVFRNAVDHGVETPEERFESGKPEFGAITCSVTREGDEAVIEITDDGRGVDVDALRANSVRNSILTAKQAERMSREEALNLAFAMGLSSKTEADGLSGRGVGLSALQAAVNGLGGSVQLQSEQGRGSRVIVRAPVDRIRAS